MDMPLHVAVGVRYEETEVTSSALVPIPTGLVWAGNNEFTVQFGPDDFTTLRGKYEYWLPSLDLGLELTDSMILRGSYGHSIGRPQWNHLQGGQTIDRFTGSEGRSDERRVGYKCVRKSRLRWTPTNTKKTT